MLSLPHAPLPLLQRLLSLLLLSSFFCSSCCCSHLGRCRLRVLVASYRSSRPRSDLLRATRRLRGQSCDPRSIHLRSDRHGSKYARQSHAPTHMCQMNIVVELKNKEEKSGRDSVDLVLTLSSFHSPSYARPSAHRLVPWPWRLPACQSPSNLSPLGQV